MYTSPLIKKYVPYGPYYFSNSPISIEEDLFATPDRLKYHFRRLTQIDSFYRGIRNPNILHKHYRWLFDTIFSLKHSAYCLLHNNQSIIPANEFYFDEYTKAWGLACNRCADILRKSKNYTIVKLNFDSFAHNGYRPEQWVFEKFKRFFLIPKDGNHIFQRLKRGE